MMTSMARLRGSALVAAMALGLTALPIPAVAAVPVTLIVSDPFTNATSQHRTAVEPDTFAYGSTVVAAYQVGRFTDGGSSGIGFAVTTNGSSWSQGTLPGIVGGQFERVSDPSVAYDAAHAVWMISSIPITASGAVPAVYVSRSTNGGASFDAPVTVVSAAAGQDFDKNWTACDNQPTSPFFGHCYTTFDDFGAGDLLLVSTSTDGGLHWSVPQPTANRATGLGGQPVVQPNGTVVIPAANASESGIISFRSTDGGATWSSSTTISAVTDHTVAGNLRTGPLPTAEIDASGKVYVVWQDCRFRRGCKTNDLVMATSTNGQTWSAVTRVPIDATTSNVDHFIPGLGVDPATSGTAAKLGLTYYFYRDARCTTSGKGECQLEVGYIQSADGGVTWSNHTDVAGPFGISLTPDTTQGRMVGDYISTSWSQGRAFGAFAVARPASGGFAFDQAGYVPAGGLTAASGGYVNTSQGDKAVPNAASDHAAARSAIRQR